MAAQSSTQSSVLLCCPPNQKHRFYDLTTAAAKPGGPPLHLHVEAVRTGIELGAVGLRCAGARVVRRDPRVGVAHALQREKRILLGILHEERRGGGAGGDVGEIAMPAPSGGEQHPGVRHDVTAEQLLIGRHHPRSRATSGRRSRREWRRAGRRRKNPPRRGARRPRHRATPDSSARRGPRRR